jgi:multicomponent Na+:H+ antiporter subunit D
MKTSWWAGLFDNRVIDGLVDGVASGVRGLGGRLRRLQRGSVQESLTLALTVVMLLFLVFLYAF